MMPFGNCWSGAAGFGDRIGRAVPRLAAPWPMVVLLAIGLSAVSCTRTALGRGIVRPKCRVQIVSVKLSKGSIRRAREPGGVTLRVTVDVRGHPPKGATATVEVGTYSSDPPANNLVYAPTERTLELKPGHTVVEFSIRPGPKTLTGSVVVAATLQLRKQRGVDVVSMQPNYREWRVRLITRVP